MNRLLSNLKNEVEQIKVPEDKLDAAIKRAIKKGDKKKWSWGKKIAFFNSAAVLLVSLLIGSAFVSPAMAEVASKIPYLNQVFQSRDVGTLIHEELKNKGYKIQGIGVMYSPRKTLTIDMKGSEQYIDDVKEEVKQIAKDVLESKGYDAYRIEVNKAVEPDPDPETREEVKNFDQLYKKITKELKSRKLNFVSMGITLKPKTISIDVPDTEARLDEVRKTVHQVLEKEGLKKFSVEIRSVKLEAKQKEDKWAHIVGEIAEGLMAKKEYKVTGISYSLQHEALQITLTTSVQSGDPEAKKHGKKIEQTIQQFLESKEMKDWVEDQRYGIVVYSKDKKKIN